MATEPGAVDEDVSRNEALGALVGTDMPLLVELELLPHRNKTRLENRFPSLVRVSKEDD